MTAERTWSYLTGLEYPASKADAIGVAEADGAPQEMIEFLQSLPGERFEDAAGLHVAMESRARQEPV